MRPDNNSFDDSIKRKLQDDEEPVSGALWSSISKEIPSRSPGNRKFLYYSIALLLLLTGSLYYFTGDDSKEEVAGKNSSLVKSGITSSAGGSSSQGITNGGEHADVLPGNSSAVASNTSVSNSDQAKDKIKRPVNSALQSQPAFSNEVTVPAENGEISSLLDELVLSGYIGISLEQFGEELNLIVISQELKDHSLADVSAELAQNDSAIIAGGLKNNAGIEFSFSPDFIFKKWSLNNATQEYLDTRKETESFVFAHTYGGKVFFKVAKGVHLKTGMYLSEITEVLHYSYLKVDPNDLFTKLGGSNGVWFNPLTQQTSNDTSIANYVYPDDVVSSNTYKFYNLPVQVAVYKDIKRFRYGASAGAMMNLRFKQKGSIMKEDKYGKILFADKNMNPYKSVIGVGLTASSFVSYKIRKNVNFFIEPEYRVYLKPISKKDAPLTEKLSTLSIMSGLQLEF